MMVQGIGCISCLVSCIEILLSRLCRPYLDCCVSRTTLCGFNRAYVVVISGWDFAKCVKPLIPLH